MYIYNYSALKKRDKKVYSVGGTRVSNTGISTTFLKLVIPSFLVFTLIGLIPAAIFGSLKVLVFFAILGIAAGFALWYIKIESYRLYQYLIAYFKPKKTYHNLNTRNKEYNLHTHRVKGIVQSEI